MSYFSRPTEQQVLAFSVITTIGLAIMGVSYGLFTRSQSIVFDGVFSIVDFLMSALVLFVARLLKRSGSRRFQYGYWHFEPLVSAFRGLVLFAVCLYALINGVKGILSGGHDVELSDASVYAGIVFFACVGLYWYERRVNLHIKSEFIRIDMHSCLMSACITLALFVGFLTAELLDYFGYGELKRYADSSILVVMTLALLPIPAGIIYRSIQEVFMVAPLDVAKVVNQIMSEVAVRYGFVDFKAYVAKSGRIHLIDIVILVSEDFNKTTIEMDGIRDEISRELSDYARPDQWLTISFTTRREWL
jgi:predicted Co/Zn/Cd cation transporter (cation efflux family)